MAPNAKRIVVSAVSVFTLCLLVICSLVWWRYAGRRRSLERHWTARTALVITQIRLAPDGQSMLVEEAVTDRCVAVPGSFRKWIECIHREIGFEQWLKTPKLFLRLRDPLTGRITAELGSRSRFDHRVLDYRSNHFVEAITGEGKLQIRSVRRPSWRKTLILDRDSDIHGALLLEGNRLMVGSSRGVGYDRRALLQLFDWDNFSSPLATVTIKYKPKKFLGPNVNAMEMWQDAWYDLCKAGRQYACRDLKKYGMKYSVSLKRDQGISIAASVSGKRIAAYVFGDLYLYRREGTALIPERRVREVFYENKDWYLKKPKAVWSPDEKYIVLYSYNRVIRIVDTNTGKVFSLKDQGRPIGWKRMFTPSLRGLCFDPTEPNILYYGQLDGNVVRVDLVSRASRPYALPLEDLETATLDAYDDRRNWVGYLGAGSSILVAWADGAVWILDRKTGKVRGRLGSTIARIFAERLYSHYGQQ